MILMLSIVLHGCVIDLSGNELVAAKELISSFEEAELKEEYEEVNADLKLDAVSAIISGSGSKLAEGSFRYNYEGLKPKFEAIGNNIRITSANPGVKIKKIINEWDVALTERYPINMNIDADGSKVELDLSDIKLKTLSLDLGGASAKLYSDKPNDISMGEFKVIAAASSLNMTNVGNMNFEKLYLASDASRLSLDLSGQYKSSAVIELEANTSTVKLNLPEDIGIRLMVDKSEISTIKMNSGKLEQISEKEYLSRDFEAAAIKLNIVLKLNVTTLTIE